MQIPYPNRNSYQTRTPTRTMSLMNTTRARVPTYSIANTNLIQLTLIIKSFHFTTIINVNTVLVINHVIVDVEINLNNIVDIKKTYRSECSTECYTFFITHWCTDYRLFNCIAYSIHDKDCVCRPYRFA